MNRFLVSALLAAVLGGCAGYAYSAPPVTMKDGMLVNAQGLTLYTFDRDPVNGGKSVCNGNCTALWPPLLATAADQPSGDYTLVVRDDGSRQWAYKGKPLYMWSKDKNPGEKTGDNFNNIWHVAR